MNRLLFIPLAVLSVSLSLSAQGYKLETISTPPPGLPAAYSSTIAAQGYRVVGPKGPWCEVWFRKSIPTGAKPTDNSIVFPIVQGTLLAVLNFPQAAADRRGQPLKAGLYTLRYSDYPVDGAHQGVAPQRDFALLIPVASDADPNSTPDFGSLVKASVAGCGTAHPAVLSLESPSGTNFPSVSHEGDNDEVLSVKVGDLPISIIVAGKAE